MPRLLTVLAPSELPLPVKFELWIIRKVECKKLIALKNGPTTSSANGSGTILEGRGHTGQTSHGHKLCSRGFSHNPSSVALNTPSGNNNSDLTGAGAILANAQANSTSSISLVLRVLSWTLPWIRVGAHDKWSWGWYVSPFFKKEQALLRKETIYQKLERWCLHLVFVLYSSKVEV